MNSVFWFTLLVVLLIVERLQELWSGRRNISRLLESGGREFGAAHFGVIVSMHTAFFISLVTEFFMRGISPPSFWLVPLALFLIAQLLRFSARRAMGNRWTTRIIVVPGEELVRSGPFRWMHHPIYVAVALELFSLPLIFGLYWTCAVFTILNAVMLLGYRIPMEQSALLWSQEGRNST